MSRKRRRAYDWAARPVYALDQEAASLILSLRLRRAICPPDAPHVLCRLKPKFHAAGRVRDRWFFSWLDYGEFADILGVPAEALIDNALYTAGWRKGRGLAWYVIPCEAYRQGYRDIVDVVPPYGIRHLARGAATEEEAREIARDKVTRWLIGRANIRWAIVLDVLEKLGLGIWHLVVRPRVIHGRHDLSVTLATACSLLDAASYSTLCGLAVLLAQEGLPEHAAVAEFRRLWRLRDELREEDKRGRAAGDGSASG